jgi:AcrR family transcriptional regulator
MSDTSPPKLKIVAGPKPTLRKSERTQQAILDAAVEFLWVRPFREMKVADLTTIAGCSRPAFYQYFGDLHTLMDRLLSGLSEDLFTAAAPWFTDQGDPATLLQQSMHALVLICHQRGPILRAVTEASTTDERLERSWSEFVGKFDEAVTRQIERHQAKGLILPFDARPVAVSLNQLDVAMLVKAFGHHPRSNPDTVCDALVRIWVSTLYGRDYVVVCSHPSDEDQTRSARAP